MAREPRPVAGLMDTNVPSQLDEEDLAEEYFNEEYLNHKWKIRWIHIETPS